jgi:sucrose-phosphate synthase
LFHYRVLICLIQIEGEEASRLAKQRLEREKARRYAAADMSEDLSEGEKGENINESSSTHDESTRGRMPRIGSTDAIEAWASQHKDKKLYIVLISIHGLIRGENMELGRDSDTGGQVLKCVSCFSCQCFCVILIFVPDFVIPA